MSAFFFEFGFLKGMDSSKTRSGIKYSSKLERKVYMYTYR